jgi:hypothetical protein
MSRAINLRLPEAEVRAECERRNISISALEPLPSGGTHLVCITGRDADQVRLHLEAHIIDGAVKRFPFFRGRDAR